MKSVMIVLTPSCLGNLGRSLWTKPTINIKEANNKENYLFNVYFLPIYFLVEFVNQNLLIGLLACQRLDYGTKGQKSRLFDDN